MHPPVRENNRRGAGDPEALGQFNVIVDLLRVSFRPRNFPVGKGFLEHFQRFITYDALRFPVSIFMEI